MTSMAVKGLVERDALGAFARLLDSSRRKSRGRPFFGVAPHDSGEGEVTVRNVPMWPALNSCVGLSPCLTRPRPSSSIRCQGAEASPKQPNGTPGKKRPRLSVKARMGRKSPR